MRRASDLSIHGTLSRRGALKRAIRQIPIVPEPNNSRILIDHNENKLVPARALWGDLAFLNPYDVPPTAHERLLLVVGQLLPNRHRRVLQAFLTAYSVARVLPPGAQIFIWNPTQIFHHCMVECLGAEECMIFNPIVPLPTTVEGYAGRKLVMDVYGIPGDKFREATPQFTKSDLPPRVAIYLTKLPDSGPIRSKAERRIVEFGNYLINLGIETRFFLHYLDRSQPLRAAELGIPSQFCILGDSMHLLAKTQISLSGESTVGLDLNALDCGHFFCIDTERPDVFRSSKKLSPLAAYLSKTDRHLRHHESNDEWISKIERHEPSTWTVIAHRRRQSMALD